MQTSKEILAQLQAILKNQQKYFILVPIVGFALGGLLVWIQNLGENSTKYTIS